jgi:hypothetical protein
MMPVRALLVMLFCLPALAGEAWAVRRDGVIEIPARAGKDIGFALCTLDGDRLRLADGAIVLKTADSGQPVRDKEPLDYRTIGMDAPIQVDFVGQPKLLRLTGAETDRVVSFAKANGVKAVFGYVYPELVLAGDQAVRITSMDGKPVAELGDLVAYVTETVARHPGFFAKRVRRIVLFAP